MDKTDVIFKWLSGGTATGVLGFFLYLFLNGGVVTGKNSERQITERDETIRELKRDRDWWKSMALSYMQAGRKIIASAESEQLADDLAEAKKPRKRREHT